MQINYNFYHYLTIMKFLYVHKTTFTFYFASLVHTCMHLHSEQ